MLMESMNIIKLKIEEFSDHFKMASRHKVVIVLYMLKK